MCGITQRTFVLEGLTITVDITLEPWHASPDALALVSGVLNLFAQHTPVTVDGIPAEAWEATPEERADADASVWPLPADPDDEVHPWEASDGECPNCGITVRKGAFRTHVRACAARARKAGV